MISEVASKFPWIYLSEGALIVFLALFASVYIWTFRKDSKRAQSEASELPFNEGELS